MLTVFTRIVQTCNRLLITKCLSCGLCIFCPNNPNVCHYRTAFVCFAEKHLCSFGLCFVWSSVFHRFCFIRTDLLLSFLCRLFVIIKILSFDFKKLFFKGNSYDSCFLIIYKHKRLIKILSEIRLLGFDPMPTPCFAQSWPCSEILDREFSLHPDKPYEGLSNRKRKSKKPFLIVLNVAFCLFICYFILDQYYW